MAFLGGGHPELSTCEDFLGLSKETSQLSVMLPLIGPILDTYIYRGLTIDVVELL